MIGFVYEADQDAIKEAQDRVDELMHQETLNKIDEVIEAIEKGKENDNVYNYEGTDVIKNFANLTGDELYDFARSFTDIGDLLANSLDRAMSISTSADTTNAPVTISIGDIVLENVSSADDLAQRIVNELPNRIIQRLYN